VEANVPIHILRNKMPISRNYPYSETYIVLTQDGKMLKRGVNSRN